MIKSDWNYLDLLFVVYSQTFRLKYRWE